ncbi:DUF937 domain-containing protein [Echinicola vietnamensis]|uniref:DUF937 domain-containing protein n=1 Tax=Echinicola vietnamensis (strain DSM 17526 / LMG 23754 / KMM 6221) TaxID=926556 RepID=L0G412_ECHVK|nr:DUF937 domain-containing protein [Echinicola vietnamensis]AGA79555.1 hypothetical protein Echvi_3332 [Echinicola vietnamensis DSM 17526]
MINEILKNVGPEVISKITGQFGLSEEQASKAVDTTQESLTATATKEAAGGNIDGLLNMINQGSGAAGGSMFQKFAGNLASDYISKLGISEGIAQQISNFVLPLVLDKIMGQTGGNAGKGDLMKLIGGSAGDILKGKAGDMLGGLGNMFK